MNIEHIARKSYHIKLSLSSTGYFNLTCGSITQEFHAVAGDHLNVYVDVIWGRNKLTFTAIDELEIEFCTLMSDVPVTDWEGNDLTELCKNQKVEKGDTLDLFFTYPTSLDEEYLKMNKDDMLYYE